jgi:hypothetical protein
MTSTGRIVGEQINWKGYGRKVSLSNWCRSTQLLCFNPLRCRHWRNQNKNPPSIMYIYIYIQQIRDRKLQLEWSVNYLTTFMQLRISEEMIRMRSWTITDKTNLFPYKLQIHMCCGGIAPLIRGIGTWWKWVVNVMPQSLYLRRISYVSLDRELCGRCLVEEVKFCTLPRIEPRLLRCSARSIVILLTMLSQFPWMVSGYELVLFFFENYEISRDFSGKNEESHKNNQNHSIV